GVLGQQEVDLVVAVGDGGVAAVDVVHAVDGVDSLIQCDAVDGGRADGLGGVTAVGLAGEVEVQDHVALGGAHGVTVDRPGGGGAFEGATVEKLLGGAPVVALVDDAAFGAGAGDGVALPAAAGGDPDDVGGVEGDGGDQDVIAVGHHDHVRVGAHRIAQDAFDLVDLPDAVELVAGGGAQHQAGPLPAGAGGGDVEFIDFEDHMGGFAPGE